MGEPSFGIDRIFSALLDHVYYMRPKEKGDDADEKQTRGVLKLAPNVAPYKCILLPLDQRIARDERYRALMNGFRNELSSLGLSYATDESGATVGRRYSRNDELGTPLAVTFDFTTLEDNTVTLRERDSCDQIRLPLAEVADLVASICSCRRTWAEVSKQYPSAKEN